MSDWVQESCDWYEFCNKGLAKPGTLVEVKVKDPYFTRPKGKKGKKVEPPAVKKQFLIGNINTVGGVCDDCVAFDGKSVVTKYKVLVQQEW